MSLSSRLTELHERLDFSRQGSADVIGVHVNGWKKYESVQAQPFFEILKKMAVTLHVIANFFALQ